jgi:hypothetical protein
MVNPSTALEDKIVEPFRFMLENKKVCWYKNSKYEEVI